MTVSDKQLAANRANAQASTGPRTPEGKARSALNGLTHGLYAGHVVLPGEDPAEFEAMTAGFLETLHPVGPVETAIVTRMAIAAWRLRRAAVAECAVFSTEPPESVPAEPADEPAPSVPIEPSALATAKPSGEAGPSEPTEPIGPVIVIPPKESVLPDPPEPAHPGVAYLRRARPGQDPIGGISRHEARLHRQFSKDLALLQTARALRLEREAEVKTTVNPMANRYDKGGYRIGRYSTFTKHRQLLDLEVELGLHGPDGPPP